MDPQTFPDAYFGTTDTRIDMPEAIRAYLPAFKRPLLAFIESLPPGASLLDVGCGSGKALRMIRALRPDVKLSGMDLSDMSAHLPSEVAFKQGRVEDLKSMYKDERFDAVICQHVIEHLIYPMELMEGITTLLKDGGRMYMETPNWTRLIAPFAHFYFYNDYTHVRPFSRFSMSRLLLDYRYDTLEIRTLSSCSWFPRRRRGGEEREKATSEITQERQGLMTRMLARLLNPLMRDVLIATAVKKDGRA